MRRRERAWAGDVNDDVCQSRAKQKDEHNIANTAYRTAAANVVSGKRRENARGMRGVRHRISGAADFAIGRWLKPKEQEKVAQKNAHWPQQ